MRAVLKTLILCGLLALLMVVPAFPAGLALYGANPPACTCAVVTRGFVPWLFNATNKQEMSRTEHILQDSVTSLQIVIPNWYVDTTNNTSTYTELGTGGTLTATASIETAGGAISTFTFSASSTGTVASGGNLVSDPLAFTGSRGDVIYDRIWVSNPAGILYSTQGNASLGDRLRLGVSGITDQTAGGTISNDNPNWSAPPISIIASTQRQSYFLSGTSRTAGVSDTIDSSGNIGIQARSIGPGSAYTMVGIPGDKASFYVLSSAKRAAVANSYFTAVSVEYGVNDTYVPATIEANLQTIYALTPTKRIYGVTLDPLTSSSDSFATAANQTILQDFSVLNTYLRAKPTPVFGVFDAAIATGSAAKWLTNGTANWCTSDGLHELYVCEKLIQSSGVVAP